MLSLVVILAALAPALATRTRAAAGPGASGNPLCAQAKILASGIAINIMDQQSELATAQSLAAMLAGTPNPQQYEAEKDLLLQFINNGIAIRQMNQLITPKNNKATLGLAVVANAQLEELGLAMNLTGDPTNDKPIVQTLIKDFTGGIAKNQENQAAAMTGCQ